MPTNPLFRPFVRSTARPLVRLAAAAGIAGALLAAAPGTAAAGCGVVINEQPITAADCAVLHQIYGSVVPGRYVLYADGTWVNRANPAHHGNLYADARRAFAGIGGGGGGGGGDGGMQCGPFGCVGGGYYWDPETGASVGP